MIGIIRFVLQITVLAVLAFWLADSPGIARIEWHGRVIETSAAFLAMGAVALAYILHLLFRVWHFLRHGPALWRMQRKLDKIRSGQEQLTKGLVAIASGNSSEAGRLAVAARKNIGNGAAAQWLQAQAAQLAGDSRSAQEIFRSLASSDETAILGYRGLISQAKRDGDWGEIDRLLTEMNRIKPVPPWLSLMRMESAARRRQWEEAESSLSHAASARLMDTESGRRARAALRIAASRTAAIAGNEDSALQAAEQAVKQAPTWLPAQINLVETLSTTGHKRAATRAIERAWKTNPHPHLAQLLLRMADTPLDGFRQTERLCRINELAVESRLALAEAALAADVWGEARRQLTATVNDGTATQGVYKMLVRLERLERRDERAATLWFARASEAPPDPVWLCRVCCGSHENWDPVCGDCGSFDSLDWRSPGKSSKALSCKKDFLSDD
ncbi:MAG: heme biosynthesis HemY N-terminal domain-containing protein [Alphaproteobacteria bacterium]|nr:heme biosynthesis HemY N-terminal domain-containing protein [Alphaproteobacteria bacterium]